MKKLFALTFSALMVLGAAACGSKAPHDPNFTYHAVGGWGSWDALDDNTMTAITKDEAVALGVNFGERPVQYVYKYDLTVGTASAGWECKAKVNGEVKTLDGKFAIKALVASYDKKDEVYNNEQWIPNPENGGYAHVEALTDNIFFPTYQEEKDSDGFSWADNPVITSGEGSYTFICAKYTTQSSATEIGYGFALFKK